MVDHPDRLPRPAAAQLVGRPPAVGAAHDRRGDRRRRLGRPRRDLRRRAAPGPAAARRRRALDRAGLFDLAGVRSPGRAAAIGTVDAPDRHGLTGGVQRRQKTLARVVSPFEVACLDLQGQATGRPVWALLGGRVRDTRAVLRRTCSTSGPPTPAPSRTTGARRSTRPASSRRPGGWSRVRLQVDQAQGRGVPAGRGDRGDPGAARRRSPTIRCGWTRTRAWTVETSIRVAEETDGLLEYLEDPTPGMAGMAEVAARGADAAGHQHVRRRVRATCRRPVRARVGADRALRPPLLGRAARVARSWPRSAAPGDVGLSMHSNSHLGHQPRRDDPPRRGHAQPDLRRATPTRRGSSAWTWWSRPLSIRGRCGAVPDAPGLGVTLDRDALARMHEDYLRVRDPRTGRHRVHATVPPDYEKRRPRW